MPLTDDTRAFDLELALEQRFGEALPPWPGGAQHFRQLHAHVRRRQFAVGQYLTDEITLLHARTHLGVEGEREGVEVGLVERQAGRHRVTAETSYQAGIVRGHRVQRVAYMQSGHRARGALDLAFAGRREGDDRPVRALAQARGEDAGNTLVPAGVVQAKPPRQTRRIGIDAQPLERHQRFLLHDRLDLAAFAVELVEFAGHAPRRLGVFTHQALDTGRHVGQPAGGVQTRTDREAQVGGNRARDVAPGHLQQRFHARTRAPGTDTPQTLLDENAVVAVERHDIGNGAERHQVEQIRQRWLGARRGLEPATVAQVRAQRDQQVEHDAAAGQRLARERIPGQVRIDDGIGIGEHRARQMVVGDEHVDAGGARRGDTLEAGDAVVDREQQVRLRALGEIDDLGRESVTELETVRHQETDLGGTERAQTEHGDRGTGGAIGVEVAHHDDASLTRQCVGQQLGGLVDAAERLPRQQRRERVVEIGRLAHRARQVDTLQHRVQIGAERHAGRRWRTRHQPYLVRLHHPCSA